MNAKYDSIFILFYHRMFWLADLLSHHPETVNSDFLFGSFLPYSALVAGVTETHEITRHLSKQGFSNLSMYWDPLESLLQLRLWGSTSRVSESVVWLGWRHLRTYVFRKLSGNAEAAGPGITL